MPCRWGVLTLLCLCTAALGAGDPPPQSTGSVREASEEPTPPPSTVEDTNSEQTPSPAGQEDANSRTELNLLGEVDVEAGESRRNENVRISLIDNNVLKELNKRVGTTATLVQELDPEKGYFGGEYGGSPASPIHLIPLLSG